MWISTKKGISTEGCGYPQGYEGVIHRFFHRMIWVLVVLASAREASHVLPYRSSTSAVLLAYAVLLASKKSVFTILALEYCPTHFMFSGSFRLSS